MDFFVLSHGLTRWHAASASAFLEANAGLQYVFGDVSGSLRSRLGYTQRQLDGLGTAKVRAPVPPCGCSARERAGIIRRARVARRARRERRRACARAAACAHVKAQRNAAQRCLLASRPRRCATPPCRTCARGCRNARG
jgi:hypothetical protein